MLFMYISYSFSHYRAIILNFFAYKEIDLPLLILCNTHIYNQIYLLKTY